MKHEPWSMWWHALPVGVLAGVLFLFIVILRLDWFILIPLCVIVGSLLRPLFAPLFDRMYPPPE